jgi:hypothetical protein
MSSLLIAVATYKTEHSSHIGNATDNHYIKLDSTCATPGSVDSLSSMLVYV